MAMQAEDRSIIIGGQNGMESLRLDEGPGRRRAWRPVWWCPRDAGRLRKWAAFRDVHLEGARDLWTDMGAGWDCPGDRAHFTW